MVACAASVFLSAFLLFGVQPYAARLLLPTFGGSPAVWTLSLVFFQVGLLAGYAYTHQGALRATPRRAWLLHLGLLTLGLLVLPPVVPALSAGPPGGRLVVVLAAAVGLPFVLLSTNAPLVQRWLALAGRRDPYFLYAASNAGSLLALVAYPLVIEPKIGLADQGRLLASGYALFAGSVAWIGWLAVRREHEPARETATEAHEAPSWPRRLRWLGLSATGSALLLGATLRITTDVAPVPLLWVLPLGLYLLTFVVAFGGGVRLTGSTRVVLLAATTAALGTLLLQRTGPAPVLLAVHLAAMTGGCLVCHGRLAEDRPEARWLTSFYLWLAIGGAVGGLLAQLVAPLLFDDVVEYPLALLAALLWLAKPGELRLLRGRVALMTLAATVVSFAAVALVVHGCSSELAELALHLPIVTLLAALAWRRGRTFLPMAAATVTLLVTGLHVGHVVDRERGFYGVVTVVDRDGVREMLHGAILHGEEALDRPGAPRTYYEAGGPMGLLTRAVPAEGRICLVGLGAGSLSTLGRLGQRMTWFEVDPAVVRAAREHFTFLRDAPGEVEVVLGDARLTLAGDDGGCDLLISDAFSGDVVPVHLLTTEALEVYRSALAPGGVLAFHASSRFFDLLPVLRGLAAEGGLEGWVRIDVPDEERRARGARGSRVVALVAPGAGVPAGGGWRPLGAEPAVRWTDDKASLMEVWVPMRELVYLLRPAERISD